MSSRFFKYHKNLKRNIVNYSLNVKNIKITVLIVQVPTLKNKTSSISQGMELCF